MGSGVKLKSKTASAIECLHYAMNLPTAVVITGDRQLRHSRPGIRSGSHFPAAVAPSGSRPAGEDSRRGRPRQRAFQDDGAFRLHGGASGMAGRQDGRSPGTRAKVTDGTNWRRACVYAPDEESMRSTLTAAGPRGRPAVAHCLRHRRFQRRRPFYPRFSLQLSDGRELEGSPSRPSTAASKSPAGIRTPSISAARSTAAPRRLPTICR